MITADDSGSVDVMVVLVGDSGRERALRVDSLAALIALIAVAEGDVGEVKGSANEVGEVRVKANEVDAVEVNDVEIDANEVGEVQVKENEVDAVEVNANEVGEAACSRVGSPAQQARR